MALIGQGYTSVAHDQTNGTDFAECIREARVAFTDSWQDWQTNNMHNPDPTEGILGAIEAFRDALGECLGEDDLGTNTCWQSARETFLTALSDCRDTNSTPATCAPSNCVRVAVQALITDFAECRGEDLGGDDDDDDGRPGGHHPGNNN